MSPEERQARMRLSAALEPGQPWLLRAVHQTSARDVADRLATGEGTLDPDGRLARRLQATRHEDVAERAGRAGLTFLVPGDPGWPAGLDDLAYAERERRGGLPVGVWACSARGTDDLPDHLRRSVAVVGARAATTYGTAVATEWAAAVADRDVTVVSGAAYGIDAAAHRGALAASGPTVAVLAGGLDQAYPRGNAALIARIGEQGWLLSEAAPGTTVNRGRFLSRNRIIAALTRATLVVEAGARSGALSTARWAEHLLRPVAAVPGPVTSAMSLGTHQLLREHDCVLVSRPDEVVELVGDLGSDAAAPPPRPGAATDGLAETTMTVHEALPARGTVTVAELMDRTGLTLPAVMRGLDDLASRSLASGAGEQWRRRTPRRVDP